MYKPEAIPENETHKFFWDFEIQTYHQIIARRQDLVLVKKKKRTCHLVDFSVLAHYNKMKKRKMIDKYLDLSRKLKNLWNISLTVILLVVGALETVPKGLKKKPKEFKIKERIKIIQTTAVLRLARILRRVLEI